MKLTRLFLASLFSIVLITEAATAQYQPLGKQLGEVSAALRPIQGKSVVYQPTDPTEKKLFYVPFFALKMDKAGSNHPKVEVQESPNDGNGLVTLTLLLSPQDLVDGIAAFISANAEMKAADPRYAVVTNFNLTGIPLSNLSVDEVEPRLGFKQVMLPRYGAQGELKLIAEMPMAKAKLVAANIEKGIQIPQFDIRYDLSADQELSQTDILASMAYLYKTDAVKDLISAKPAGEKFGWKVGGDGVKLDQPFVTLSQKQEFEGRTRTEVRVITRIGDEKDVAFVKQMLGYFDAVFQKDAIDTETSSLGRELKNLSSYGLDTNDLKADKIDELVVKVKDFFSQEDADKKMFEFKTGASASFLGISASGNLETKMSGESLRKQMRDKGWDFQVKGQFLVPKSFEIHILNSNKMKTEGAVSGAIIGQQRGFTGFIHRVSAANLYFPTQAKDENVVVAQLRAQVDKLTREVGAANAAKPVMHVVAGPDSPDKVGFFQIR